jgi:hypothetical protein
VPFDILLVENNEGDIEQLQTDGKSLSQKTGELERFRRDGERSQ